MPDLIGADQVRRVAEAALETRGGDGVEVVFLHQWGGLTRFAHSAIHQSTWREDTAIRVRVVTDRRQGVAAHPDEQVYRAADVIRGSQAIGVEVQIFHVMDMDPAEAVVTTRDGEMFRLERVAGDLQYPTDVAFAPDGRVFVAERDNGLLCGMVEAGVRPFANGVDEQPCAFIEGWWVDPRTKPPFPGRALGTSTTLTGPITFAIVR